MAIKKLPTNLVDDIIDTSVSDNRMFRLTEVEPDTYTFEDVTQYKQKGSLFNAERVNETNGVINSLIDQNEQIETSIDDIVEGNTLVGKARHATTADKATKLITPVKINGVDFDGSKDITISDNTKLSKQSDFVLKNVTLNFASETVIVSDERITSSALADVYFDADSVTEAKNCNIVVNTNNGYVEFVAGTRPTKVLTASIHIKVV